MICSWSICLIYRIPKTLKPQESVSGSEQSHWQEEGPGEYLTKRPTGSIKGYLFLWWLFYLLQLSYHKYMNAPFPLLEWLKQEQLRKIYRFVLHSYPKELTIALADLFQIWLVIRLNGRVLPWRKETMKQFRPCEGRQSGKLNLTKVGGFLFLKIVSLWYVFLLENNI